MKERKLHLSVTYVYLDVQAYDFFFLNIAISTTIMLTELTPAWIRSQTHQTFNHKIKGKCKGEKKKFKILKALHRIPSASWSETFTVILFFDWLTQRGDRTNLAREEWACVTTPVFRLSLRRLVTCNDSQYYARNKSSFCQPDRSLIPLDLHA